MKQKIIVNQKTIYNRTTGEAMRPFQRNLGSTNLRGANMRCWDLSGVDLSYACLWETDLIGANLSGAKLKRADLSYTDLRDTNIRFTDFSDAILDDVLWPKDLTPISPQEREHNLRTVAALALAPNSLSMGNVHTCDTTHCMAGWATHALPGGYKLEDKYGWEVAGFHLLGNGAARLFYASFSDALKFLIPYTKSNLS